MKKKSERTIRKIYLRFVRCKLSNHFNYATFFPCFLVRCCHRISINKRNDGVVTILIQDNCSHLVIVIAFYILVLLVLKLSNI